MPLARLPGRNDETAGSGLGSGIRARGTGTSQGEEEGKESGLKWVTLRVQGKTAGYRGRSWAWIKGRVLRQVSIWHTVHRAHVFRDRAVAGEGTGHMCFVVGL